LAVASKGTPGDTKCVTEIPEGDKNKEVKGGTKLTFLFQEKIIVVTRGEICSLKFTKYSLAAGLHPDPLGELKRSPIPTSCNKGAYF